MPYGIQVKTIIKQRFSTLHDSIKPHDYPSDWNKPHDTLFDQNMGGIKQTCGINQPCGQYRTREYLTMPHAACKNLMERFIWHLINMGTMSWDTDHF